MKTTLMIATVLAAGTSAAYAQDPVTVPPPAASAPSAQTVPVNAPASVPAKPTVSADERDSEVRVLGGILVQSMNQGAADLVHQMQVIDPGSVGSAMISQAHAHGIALEGYGVLFDVDVPLMNMSLIVTQRQIVVQNLRTKIDEAARMRAQAKSPDVQDQLTARIQMLTNTLATIAPAAPPTVATGVTPVNNLQQAPAGTVVAATDDVAPVAPAPVSTPSADKMYSDAIKAALMNAMVNHSSALMLGDDEWLVVAARGNEPTIPGAIEDRSGIILRIKGSDLAAFRANKLSHDEVLKKIEIREWR
jgi:hypothetical protein